MRVTGRPILAAIVQFGSWCPSQTDNKVYPSIPHPDTSLYAGMDGDTI